jgi:Ca-activated chloride channel family protein
MEAPLQVEVTLATPAVMAGEEPEEPLFARVRLRRRPEMAVRPRVDLCFVLDASASMHRFVLDPQQRAQWQTRAEQRGEITRQQADGRTGMVWTGQTLRELQQHVSTPMLSTLRGVWRTLENLEPADMISVLAFADRDDVIYQDSGSDKAPRLAEAKTQLTRLGSGVDESGLGRGTRLEGALRHGLERLAAEADLPILRRMILVSDGIIQDYETCRPLLDWAVDRGIVISVIGVADEFDEEFLMTVADLTRGNYYYAATAPEVEQAVRSELEVITKVVGRQGSLRVFPENGCIIQDVYPISPALSEFQAVWVENGGWRFRIGDISAAQDPEFLVALAPGSLPPGEARLGTIRVEGSGAVTAGYFHSDTPVPVLVTDDARLIQARDDEVMDSVRKLEVYRLERRAAEAAGRGDQDASTRALRAATRALKAMGREDLATEMDAAADASETGTRNLSLTKRVKAGTRRLGSR